MSPEARAQTSLNRDLARGDRGEDVRILQVVLNQDSSTRIAATGPGSPGNETDYFGNLTEAAVIRYQEKHSQNILTPVGLTQGTGFVGPSTRSHITGSSVPVAATYRSDTLVPSGQSFVEDKPNLTNAFNALRRSATTNATSQDGPQPFAQTFQVPLSGVQSNPTQGPYAPYVTRVLPTQGPPGTEVTLHGGGFSTTNNTIRAGFAALENRVSPNGTTLTFTVESPFPSDLELPPFFNESVQALDYGFYVENDAGTSNAVLFRLTF